MLAFTSIGPIIYIISIYSKWSRGINHQIWAALGDANSVATEAISNVRTVRAFGRELGEIFRFNESINMALSKGVKDAIAQAGTYAVTNYIDLGAGILILGYGGKYSKRRRSNVAVIIVRVIFISPFLFYCLLLNHSFPTNPNNITNCF